MRTQNRLFQRLCAALILQTAVPWLATPAALALSTESTASKPLAWIVPGEQPILQVVVPLAPAAGSSRVIELLLDDNSLADAVVRGGTGAQLWQNLSGAKGVSLSADAGSSWFVLRGPSRQRDKVRIVLANFDLNDPQGQGKATAPTATSLRVLLPLRKAAAPVEFQLRSGGSLATLSESSKITAAQGEVPSADRNAEVRFSADAAPLNALAVGTSVTLTWRVDNCVKATLTGPIDYREPVQTITPDNGVCSGSKKVLALGEASYELTAELAGKPGSGFNEIITRTLSLNVRQLNQFATLTLTPTSVLPGGNVTVRWFLRELSANDRREAILSWTDRNGNRRLQNLQVSANQTTLGEMTFAAIDPPRDGRDTLVRLSFGEETVERSFDIERWLSAGRSASVTGALRGMAYAGGRLVLCGENGLSVSDVGGGGGADVLDDGGRKKAIGKTNDLFPDFKREVFRTVDRPPTATTGGAQRSDPHQLQNAACHAIRALDADRVVAIVTVVPSEAPEMTILSPATLTASYPVTLTPVPPVNGAQQQRRDVQIGVLGGRIVALVQDGPRDRSGDVNPRSHVNAYSISESDVVGSTGTWRHEPLLSAPELEPRYGWSMVDGFQDDRDGLILVNSVSGAVARYNAIPDQKIEANASKSDPKPEQIAGRGHLVIDSPRIGASLTKDQVAALGDGPLVNVGGTLVGLRSGLTYNPQSNVWWQGPTNPVGDTGSVVAYRGGHEPRLWAVGSAGERASLPVYSPRLFAADFFENAKPAEIPYFAQEAELTVKSRVPLVWETSLKTERTPRGTSHGTSQGTMTCTVNGVESEVAVTIARFTLAYPDRPFELTGTSTAPKVDASHKYFGGGQWDTETVSSDPCVSVTIRNLSPAKQ